MRSVADELRGEGRAAILRLSAAERVALALALGARDVETFRKAHRPELTREDAARMLERQRQSGRRPSACLRSLLG